MAWRSTLALLALALLGRPLLAAPPISTASEPPPNAQTFSQLDTNADGVLTPDEVRGVIPLS